MEYISLNFNQENNKVNLHNEYSALFTIAVKSESGAWKVDCSEVKKLEIEMIADALENALLELLNLDQATNEQLNGLLYQLRTKYGV